MRPLIVEYILDVSNYVRRTVFQKYLKVWIVDTAYH